MKKILFVLAVLALAGCEPFPDDSQTVKPDNTPHQSTEKAATPAEQVDGDLPKQSSEPAVTVSVSSSTNGDTPTVTVQSASAAVKEVQTKEVPVAPTPAPPPAPVPEEQAPKPAPKPAPAPEPEEPELKFYEGAGKLQIIGTAEMANGSIKKYYLKRIEEPEAICFYATNSMDFQLSVSCVPKK